MIIEKLNTIKIQDKTLKQGFSQIPRIVLKAEGLSLQAKTLYALLLNYAWQKGSCFPGQNRLGKDLGVHRNTIQKYLLELRDFGLIKWDRRGMNMTNIYYILSLDFLDTKQTDAQGSVHPVAQACGLHDAQDVVHKKEEVEYKKNKYKQSLTLESDKINRVQKVNSKQSNDNGELNLKTFDSEAINLAKELNDLKNIKYYQKLINRKKRGEISAEDIQTALDDTRRMIRTDQVDGTSFFRNPASWFVSVIKKLTIKRVEEVQRQKVEDLLDGFKSKFLEKTKI